MDYKFAWTSTCWNMSLQTIIFKDYYSIKTS